MFENNTDEELRALLRAAGLPQYIRAPREVLLFEVQRWAAPANAHVAALAFAATTALACTERWPAFLVMTVGLVSKTHRAQLVAAQRGDACPKMPIDQVVKSLSRFEATVRVAPALGLPGIAGDDRWCVAAMLAGQADVLVRAVALGAPLKSPYSRNARTRPSRSCTRFIMVDTGDVKDL